jgi:hypothetical protein
VDPLSVTVLGAAALTQGIAFLYGQVGDLLRRRRDRREQADAAAAAGSAVEIPPAGESGEVLAGALTPGPVDEQALERHADQLARLRGLLTPYREGDLPVEPGDAQLLERVEAVRGLLEQVYRQHITFRGESRPASGVPLHAQTGDVGDYATQVIASGERSVGVGRDLTGSVITGNDNSVNRSSST